MDKRGGDQREEGGSIKFFRRNFSVSQCSKIFVGEPFSASLISGMQKFYAYERNITVFYKKFVVSQYHKAS